MMIESDSQKSHIEWLATKKKKWEASEATVIVDSVTRVQFNYL